MDSITGHPSLLSLSLYKRFPSLFLAGLTPFPSTCFYNSNPLKFHFSLSVNLHFLSLTFPFYTFFSFAESLVFTIEAMDGVMYVE